MKATIRAKMGTHKEGIIRAISWTGDRVLAMIMIIVTTCWLTAGMNFIYVLSGLQSVPDDLYECSKLEGASCLQTVRHITLPCISPTLFFLLVINTINAFQIFTQVKLMTEGGSGGGTNVLAYSILRFKAEKKGVFYQ